MQVVTLQHVAGRFTRDLPVALDSAATLVLAFGAASFLSDPEPLGELRAAFPRAALLGCSTAGEIYGAAVFDGSLAVAVIRFEQTGLRFAATEAAAGAGSYGAAAALAQALAGPDLRGVLVLSEGVKVNGSELVRGFNDHLPSGVVITGGLAGDGERFQRTWVLVDGAPRSQAVAAVGFYGPRVRIGYGSEGGWDIFGPERLVTRSEGNVLFSLDGRPALDLYCEYLGELAAGLPSTALLFPLALRAERGPRRQVVRSVLAVDPEARSMTFAGDIPEGSRAQLMKANFDRLIHGASQAAARARPVAGGVGGDVLAVAVSCVGRRMVLGERIEEELESALEALPAGAGQVGMYSYAELSPFAAGACDLHNQTMTLTTLAEA